MTQAEIDALGLGDESYDTTKFPQQVVIGYEVFSTMSRKPILAYLTLSSFTGQWRFHVNSSRPPAGSEPEQGSFKTPAEALEGLKKWLQEHRLTR